MSIVNGIAFFLMLLSTFLFALLVLFFSWSEKTNGQYSIPLYKRVIASSPFFIGGVHFYNTNDPSIILAAYVIFFILRVTKFHS
ncbi:hypothetical protein [Arcobacter cloacae]|uniref:Uncharacterized protein n=1 Tax=Arcobacter cloacae TaxID=1054034 RepID=A0A6M8NJG3_9BACT|nr:hypothetical protein [Arcobacter cloacae]QKF89470.1 putative membrane protein [Arcobacter cloacae]RXI42714.1 hypothetical protein CP963_01480 [Arcobacter cloacae]